MKTKTQIVLVGGVLAVLILGLFLTFSGTETCLLEHDGCTEGSKPLQIPNPPQRAFPPLYAAVLPNGLDCSKVWTGDARELRRAQEELNPTPAASRPPDFYDTIAANCSQYRQQNGFLDESMVSQDEREFPLAFSVLVYKDAEQLERLLRAVYRPHNVYCIHPDLKTRPPVLRKIRALIQCLPNVVEAPIRVDVKSRWGKPSVLEPELICMEALWRMRTKWRYVMNLRAQEFPLKTNKELVRILRAYRGANDILGTIPKGKNKFLLSTTGDPPSSIALAEGPGHVTASRGFVHFLLHSEVARHFLSWITRAGLPQDIFYASLNNLHKVPGAYTGSLIAEGRMTLTRFQIWDSTKRHCSGKFVGHLCNFGLGEVATLAHSHHFVASKFAAESSPLAYDCLEQWYFQRIRQEGTTGVVDLDPSYYSDLLIVKNAFRHKDTAGIYAEEEDVLYYDRE